MTAMQMLTDSEEDSATGIAVGAVVGVAAVVAVVAIILLIVRYVEAVWNCV